MGRKPCGAESDEGDVCDLNAGHRGAHGASARVEWLDQTKSTGVVAGSNRPLRGSPANIEEVAAGGREA
jgi:hypothetical protein